MSQRIPPIDDRHPYPTRPLRRFPQFLRLIEVVFWCGVFAVSWRKGSILWPAVAGFCVSSLAWYLIETWFRCPECGGRLQSRVETDEIANEHFFYDCERCEVTYDPHYAEGPDRSDSTNDEF